METGISYAKALAMLLQGFRNSAPEDVLRADLVRVRSFARQQPIVLEIRDWNLSVDGELLDNSVSGLEALVDAMRAHGIGRINILEGAIPKELLHLAVLLAKPPGKTENDTTIFEQARELSLWSVRLLSIPKVELVSVYAEQAAMLNAKSPAEISKNAQELVAKTLAAAEASNAQEVFATLGLLNDSEWGSPDPQRKAIWTESFNTAATPVAMRLATQLLTDPTTNSSTMRHVLSRSGETGAAALIAHLLAADNLTTRRVYFDAIVGLGAGVEMLIDTLGHPQWYVVRNAALLLGEMRAAAAEKSLGRLLAHRDVRVRLAAITALSQINSSGSRALMQMSIRDESTEVRRRAARGFGNDSGPSTSAAPLLSAINAERDQEVQVELLYALGRVGSADAVQKLIRLCSSGTSDRPVSYRIAAIEALTAARQASALPFLRAMLNDPEPTVRETARNLIETVHAQVGVSR